MAEEFDMDIKIISVVEHNTQLKVTVEHAYGTDIIGLNIDDKYLDPFTEKPKWMNSVQELLSRKYAPKEKIPIEISPEFTGQTVSLSNMKFGIVTGFKKRLVQTLGFSIADADEIIKTYDDPIQLRIDVMADKVLTFKKSIRDKLEKYYGGTGLGFDSDERPEIIKLKEDGLMDEKGRPTDLMADKPAGRKTINKTK